MRFCFCVLIGLQATAGVISAQTATHVLGIYPDSTDASSRSGLPGPSSGDVLVEVRGLSFENPANVNGATGADFAGVGDVGTRPGTRGRVLGFAVTIQDQDCASTTDAFDFCIIAEDPGVPGRPGVPPAGNAIGPEVLLRTTSLSPPVGPQVCAWRINSHLATPANVLPGLDTCYYGVGLSANPAWPTDGLSVHMASFDGLGGTFPNAGDNPRNNVISLVETRDVTSGVLAPRSAPARTHALWIFLEAPVLRFGANIVAAAQVGPNPCFGAAGNYPDSCGAGNTGRMTRYPGYPGRGGIGDGFALRLDARRTPNAPGAVFFSSSSASSPSGFSASPLYLGFSAGALVLDPARIVALGFTTNALGYQFELTTPPASAFCGVTGRLAGQAAIVNTTRGLVELTNGVSTSF